MVLVITTLVLFTTLLELKAKEASPSWKIIVLASLISQ